MRFPERNFDHTYLNRFFQFTEALTQTGTKVDDYEETEQVFSRKDRKAYRQAVLGKRTETQQRVTKRKTHSLGKEGSPKAKARR